MRNKFYRTEKTDLDAWNAILANMRKDLDAMGTDTTTEDEARIYLEDLLSYAEPLGYNPEMLFLGFDRPENMPGDAREDFILRPTYLTAALIMKAVQRYPRILDRLKLTNGKTAEETVRGILTACTSRGFHGRGYDELRGMLDVMELFTKNGAPVFLRQHGKLCPAFAMCYKDTLEFMRERIADDSLRGPWGEDDTERATEILYLAREADAMNEKRLYLAYGSNLNTAQMAQRCPDAEIAGTTELAGWRLMFKGSRTGNYLTVERAEGFTVPVGVWAVSEHDEERLDSYEGYPDLYYKKEISVTLHDAKTGESYPVTAFLYIMHEERILGRPTEVYMQTCREGYRAFGFDTMHLDEAYAFSTGN